MGLNIVVCVKSVPNPEQYNNIIIDPVTKTLIRDSMSSVINPSDLHAIELAMQLKEKYGAEITLISMGPCDVEKQIRDGLSYGADQAYLLSDKRFGGADTLATSYCLAQGIQKIGKVDLILAGNESADGATTHVPSQIGEWLNLPHIMEVVDFDMCDDGSANVRKKSDNNYYDFKIQLPAVIAVSKSINNVRYPNMKGILSAKRKNITVLSVDDFEDLDERYVGLNGSPTKSGELKVVSFERNSTQLSGTSEEIAKAILKNIQPVINNL